MIVHLGVIMIAVALAASNSYTQSADAPAARSARRVDWEGHTFELVTDHAGAVDDRASVVRANVLLDGDKIYGPAITTYLRLGIDDRHAERARPGSPTTSTSRSPGGRGAGAGRREVHARGVPQADDALALDRRRGDGGRHGARRVPRADVADGRSIPCRRRCRSPPSPSRRSLVRSRRSASDAEDRDQGGWARRAPRVAPFVAVGCRRRARLALFVVLAGRRRRRQRDRPTSPLIGNVGARRDGRARRRHAVRPLAAQGQLGGAQLLHVQLRAVPPGAPRAGRVRRPAGRRSAHDGAELYTVAVGGEPQDVVEEFFADEGGDWPVIFDDDGRFSVAVRRLDGARDVDHRPRRCRRGPRDHREVTADFLSSQIQQLREGTVSTREPARQALAGLGRARARRRRPARRRRRPATPARRPRTIGSTASPAASPARSATARACTSRATTPR